MEKIKEGTMARKKRRARVRAKLIWWIVIIVLAALALAYSMGTGPFKADESNGEPDFQWT